MVQNLAVGKKSRPEELDLSIEAQKRWEGKVTYFIRLLTQLKIINENWFPNCNTSFEENRFSRTTKT